MAEQRSFYLADLQGVLTLTKDGEWWHEGRPFQNRNLGDLFHRSIIWDPETARYLIAVGRERATFRVEDTAFFVQTIDDGTLPWQLLLRDGSSQPLDPESLRRGMDDALYCTVQRAGTHCARFSRGAYQALVRHAIDDDAIAWGESRVVIPRYAPIIVLMGVMGAGKTTVGRALADSVSIPFLDADDLHPEENRIKLGRGQPLSDQDRAPWLAAVQRAIRSHPDGTPLVVACSALKEQYRSLLRGGAPRVSFVFLDAPPETLKRRLAQRAFSIAHPSLLDSQLQTLERPSQALVLDGSRSVSELVATLQRHFSLPPLG